MARVQLLLIFMYLACVLSQEGDTQITRVKPLSDEEKLLPAPREKTRSIYLVNLVPIPKSDQNSKEESTSEDNGNELKDAGRQSNPRRGHPTLFLLQKVNDDGRLPDGIYYRPNEDETETPKPAFVKDLNDLQSYLFARGPYKQPGRQ